MPDPVDNPPLSDGRTRSHMRHIAWAWFFGAGWMALTSGTPLMRFGESMGLKQYRFTWGLLVAMPYVAMLFQLLGSYLVEKTGRRKRLFFVANLSHYLLWLLIALLPFMFHHVPLHVSVVVVLAMYLGQSIGVNLATPPWTSWMAHVVPVGLRGRFFGLRLRLGLMMYVPMSLLAGWLLQGARQQALAIPRPLGLFDWQIAHVPFGLSQSHLFTIFFVVAAVVGSFDVLLLARVPDAVSPRKSRPPRLRDVLGPPLREPRFRRFLAFYLVFLLGAPGVGQYIWVNALERFHAGDLALQMMFIGIPATAEMVFAPIWGRLIDRAGRKTVWIITGAWPVVLPLFWVFIRPDTLWLAFIVQAGGNVFWNGIEQANFHNLLRFSSGRDGSSSFQATYALALAVGGAASGFLFAGLSQVFAGWTWTVGSWQFYDLHILFVIGSAIRAFAYFALLPRVDHEGALPVPEALRHLVGQVGDTAVQAILFPLRLVGLVGNDRDERD